MAIRRRKKAPFVDNSPGGLASELSQAAEAYKTVRHDVMDRGTQRVAELEKLAAEIDTEIDDLSQVIKSAQ